jgi:hypothetical protein
MNDDDQGGQRVSNQISGVTAKAPLHTPAPALARRAGTLIDELTIRLAPAGLPSDVQHIVDVAVRAGMGESDPNWIWLLPVLLRQVPAAAMRIEFEALSGALFKGPAVRGQGPSHDDENLESIVSMMATMRGELQKFPRRVGETLKPAVAEAVVDALEAAPSRVKVELDDARLITTALEAFTSLYVLAAAGLGAFSTVAAFILGAKFG